jgi:EAL domain-containing protein (putative c-di-GMP-specific phosphodiesterase class I)
VERVAGVRQLTLEPFYQSQHRTRDRSLYGIEALIRGRGADGRVHGPSSVLGPADRAGNTLEVNLAIVDSILADMAVWRRAGAQPRMSINLDARMAEVETVADSLLALAARHAVPTASLCLELTETALPNDMTRLVESLTRLRIAGFELSLDDYGTGGSNFEILRLCPFSELKIDGPILRTAVTEPVARRFVESAVQMARDLSMEVVAEGVESPAHLDLVRQLGIDVVQGFLLCRPMPAAEMLARITRVQPLARAS